MVPLNEEPGAILLILGEFKLRFSPDAGVPPILLNGTGSCARLFKEPFKEPRVEPPRLKLLLRGMLKLTFSIEPLIGVGIRFKFCIGIFSCCRSIALVIIE